MTVHEDSASQQGHHVPEKKETVLGLYVTSKEAYEKWKAEHDKVKIVDVRTPEEYLFVGHSTMAWKIPVAVQIYEWDAEKKQFPMKPLPDFVDLVKISFPGEIPALSRLMPRKRRGRRLRLQ